MNKIKYHPIIVALCNILLVMLLYSIARLFFYFIARTSYPDITASHLMEMMAGGVRFDLTAILYLSSLYLILELMPLSSRADKRYQNVAKWLFWIPNIIGIFVNCADMVYMQYTDRRTTIAFFTEFQNEDNLAAIFFTSVVQYWYVTLFMVASCTILVLLTRRHVEIDSVRPLVYYVRESVFFFLSVYMVVIGIRGGFGAYTRPITLSNAMQYTNHPRETNIVLNTPFCLMRSTESETIPRLCYLDDYEEIMSPIHRDKQHIANNQTTNVVVIILESFSKEYFGYYNSDLEDGQYRGYTPFLDSLAAVSVTYQLSLASGRKSIDAMPSVLSSIPSIISPYIVTPYSTNDISSIAECLNRIGYTTAFYHGAPNGSMGFQAYARSAGFQAYYGMDEYNIEKGTLGIGENEDFDGVWAIWDEEFLQYFGHSMSSMPEPFMTAVFTASSHHPFQVPQRYEGVFPQGNLPIHQCIGYTDNALRLFFDYAHTQPWYEHTLFVITADHTNQLDFPQYKTDKGVFEVPIIFYSPSMPDSLLMINHSEPVSQTDIMPSVLEYIGYNQDYFAFGQDALTCNKADSYAVNYNNGLYQIFSDSLLMQYNGSDIVAIYNFSDDRLLQHNLLDIMLGDSCVTSMLTYLQAYLQQYTNRLIDNRFTTNN